MKMHKVRPVLVESIEKTNIWTYKRRKLRYNEANFNDEDDTMYYELILISLEDKKIEVGDEFYSSKYETIDVLASNGVIDVFTSFKVIARQSQISPEYISKFIEQYNSDCVEDFEIEMEIRSNAALGYKEYVYLEHICDKKYVPIKIDSNINQNSYSLGEIEEFEDWEIEIYTKLTNGFVSIVEKEPIKLEDGWEAKLAIKNIPYLEHTINSLKDLRRYYIDGIQVGYQARKSEEPISYTEEEVNKLLHKFLDIQEGLNTYQRHISLDVWFEQNKKK